MCARLTLPAQLGFELGHPPRQVAQLLGSEELADLREELLLLLEHVFVDQSGQVLQLRGDVAVLSGLQQRGKDALDLQVLLDRFLERASVSERLTDG